MRIGEDLEKLANELKSSVTMAI